MWGVIISRRIDIATEKQQIDAFLQHIKEVVIPNDSDFEFPYKDYKKTGNKKHLDILVGTFAEWQFCRLWQKPEEYVFRFQKHKNSGSARMGRGDLKVERWIVLPDVWWFTKGYHLIAEIKHEYPDRDGDFVLPTNKFTVFRGGDIAGEHFRGLANIKPPIPILLLVHDHSRRGKWAINYEREDWIARDISLLPEPEMKPVPHYRIDQPKSSKLAPHFNRSVFRSLDEAIEEAIKNARKS